MFIGSIRDVLYLHITFRNVQGGHASMRDTTGEDTGNHTNSVIPGIVRDRPKISMMDVVRSSHVFRGVQRCPRLRRTDLAFQLEFSGIEGARCAMGDVYAPRSCVVSHIESTAHFIPDGLRHTIGRVGRTAVVEVPCLRSLSQESYVAAFS